MLCLDYKIAEIFMKEKEGKKDIIAQLQNAIHIYNKM